MEGLSSLKPLLPFVKQLGRGDIRNTRPSIQAFYGRLPLSLITSGSVVWLSVSLMNINTDLALLPDTHVPNIWNGFVAILHQDLLEKPTGFQTLLQRCQTNIKCMIRSWNAIGRIIGVPRGNGGSSNGRGAGHRTCLHLTDLYYIKRLLELCSRY